MTTRALADVRPTPYRPVMKADAIRKRTARRRVTRRLALMSVAVLLCRAACAHAATGVTHGAHAGGAPTATGRAGAVATDQRLATRTGIDILERGGNAVDAAVAVAYALAVTYPEAGNLGGGGFMLIRARDGSTHFIDFRETAPAAATATMFQDPSGGLLRGSSTEGARSAGVPGTVAGLEFARERYGTLSRATLLAPAIRFADGFTLSRADAAALARARSKYDPFAASRAIFERRGAPFVAGEVLRQPDLARTLRAIVHDGAAGFYRGAVARALAASVRQARGIIDAADLAAYRPIERRPIVCARNGYRIVTAPPPSSGGVAICETLGIIGPARSGTLRDMANAHLEIEAERRSFADRFALGDPDFVANPIARVLSPSYLARARASIDPARATPSRALGTAPPTEGHNTTNFSVVDAAGNAVDVTYTLNDSFGSGFVAAGTGVLLNDEMDDFTSAPGVPNLYGLVQGASNAIAPHKRPLSSMSPTIVVAPSGRVALVAGAAGGPRIITTTLDLVRAIVDFRRPLGEAMAMPRMHMQWLPDRVDAERGAFDATTEAELRAMGYAVEYGRAGSLANAIEIDAKGRRSAVHDPRNATGNALAF